MSNDEPISEAGRELARAVRYAAAGVTAAARARSEKLQRQASAARTQPREDPQRARTNPAHGNESEQTR